VKAVVEKSDGLLGTVEVPGDKSISHRAAIVSALAEGTSLVKGYCPSVDCASTLDCLRALGVEVRAVDEEVTIVGRGGAGFERPRAPLDAGNSGTTMRLLAGALAGRGTTATITGDESLRSRPMLRILEPLAIMGARVGSSEGGRPPLTLQGGSLSGIDYRMQVPSAQVKSAVLLAGLGANGPTIVRETVKTRDHTERMLACVGIRVTVDGLSVGVEPGVPRAVQMDVPGDLSSAAFLVAAGLLCPDSGITLRSVGLNPTRMGFLELLRRMEAPLSVALDPVVAWEPRGDIMARSGELKAIELDAEDVALAIDEIPLIALLATQARGRTVISGARELRVKESDRISGTVSGLGAMGARITEIEDGMVIQGPSRLRGAVVSSAGDHRLAMMLALAGLVADGRTEVEGWEWADISYPGFAEVLESVGGRIETG